MPKRPPYLRDASHLTADVIRDLAMFIFNEMLKYRDLSYERRMDELGKLFDLSPSSVNRHVQSWDVFRKILRQDPTVDLPSEEAVREFVERLLFPDV